MFIELTDHLRCTAGHPDQFLVLLPAAMDGRRVATGSLGCPVCGRVVELADGIADFGGTAPSGDGTVLSADAVAALLSLEGPGGYVGLFGAAGGLATDLAGLMPGIRFVLVNPPPGTADSDAGSVLRAGRSPVKPRSMRAAVVARDHAADPAWARDAVDAVLPGNRAVVEGDPPERDDCEVLARAGGVTVLRAGVGRKR